MKKTVLNILFIFPFILNAQTLSIQELWNSISQSNQVKTRSMEVKIAKQNLAIERLNKLPLIYADGNLQRNLIIPTTPVPAIAFDPTAQDGAILPLKFATKWNSKAGLQAEWKFFDPSRKSNKNEKELQLLKSEVNLKSTIQNTRKDATLAYASIVLATAQYQAALVDSAQYNQILQSITKRYEAGREGIDQLILAKQEFERKKIQIFDTFSVLQAANYELEKYIDLSNYVSLSSDLTTIKQEISSLNNINYDAELNAIDIKLNENDYKAFKRQLLPSLTFNAFYGSQFFNNELNLFNSNNWFGNSYANIAIRIPLSAHLFQNVSIDKINSEKSLNQIKLEESNKLEIIQTKQNKEKIKALKNKISSIHNIIDLSKDNINKLEQEYEAGRLLLSELNSNLNKHNGFLKELWQAEYDLLSIMID